MIKKFADAREIHDAIDTVSQLRPLIDHLLLVTPHRIYLGLSVSVWTTLATLYIIFIPRWRNAKLAPRAAILTLEIFTTIFWFCALIGLWLFTVEIEPLCMVADATRVKKFIGACVIMKTATAAAALSWSVFRFPSFVLKCRVSN